MPDHFYNAGMGSEKLAQVHEGMKVVDSSGSEIGTVDRVFLGNMSEHEERLGKGPQTEGFAGNEPEATGLGDVLEDAFGRGDELPEVIADRLRREGYIHVDGGLLGRSGFVQPDQIKTVSGDTVHLAINRDQMVDRSQGRSSHD